MDGWSQYIHATLLKNTNKLTQNIHLIDILTTQLLTALQIQAGESKSNESSAIFSKQFFQVDQKFSKNYESEKEKDFGLNSKIFSKKWITINLEPNLKGTELKYIAEFTHFILNDNLDVAIFFVGSAASESLKEKINQLLLRYNLDLSQVFYFFGQTDLFIYLLSQSQRIFSFSQNETLNQLASVLGTKIFTYISRTDFIYEYGPYGNGHYIISGDKHEILDPEILYTIFMYADQEALHKNRTPLREFLKIHGLTAVPENLQIYRSKIRIPNEGGGVYYEPLLYKQIHFDEWFAQVIGHIARHWYCGWTPAIGKELRRSTLNPNLLQFLRNLNESTDALIKIYEESKNTAIKIQKKCKGLPSAKIMAINNKEELHCLTNKLLELENLVIQLSKIHFPLTFFVNAEKVLMHNLRGSQLLELSHEMSLSFDQLKQGCEILKSWIDFTLKLVKPVAVEINNVIHLKGHMKNNENELV
ncbi:MAG: hypothetical protein HY843_02540 [Bdellovibrio sp.]|nr:hypothetical protein [Bdellovibrio sp.]